MTAWTFATICVAAIFALILIKMWMRPAVVAAGGHSVWGQAEAPFWWPNAQGFAIAAIILICGTALFVRMAFQSNVDDKMLDTMITVFFTTCLVSTYNYLFGSSRGSSAKDETQNRIVERALASPTLPTPALSPAQVTGESTLKNGELAHFRTLTTEDDRLKFLAMSTAERAAAIAKP